MSQSVQGLVPAQSLPQRKCKTLDLETEREEQFPKQVFPMEWERVPWANKFGKC